MPFVTLPTTRPVRPTDEPSGQSFASMVQAMVFAANGHIFA